VTTINIRQRDRPNNQAAAATGGLSAGPGESLGGKIEFVLPARRVDAGETQEGLSRKAPPHRRLSKEKIADAFDDFHLARDSLAVHTASKVEPVSFSPRREDMARVTS